MIVLKNLGNKSNPAGGPGGNSKRGNYCKKANVEGPTTNTKRNIAFLIRSRSKGDPLSPNFVDILMISKSEQAP